MSSRPNIVLILPDQFRADALGCVGNPAVRTPNLDRIAAEGVAFTRCYTNSPVCMPARASLISGLYVNEHGVRHNDRVADRFGPSHVRNMRDAGYHTALIGKTHLWVQGEGDHTDHHLQELRDWGYVDAHEIGGTVASTILDSPYTDFLAENGLLDTYRGYMRGYLQRLRAHQVPPWEEPPFVLPTEAHVDSYIGQTAADWVSQYRGDGPFYLQVLFSGPHPPFDSPAEYRALYRPDDMPTGITEAPIPPVSTIVRNRKGQLANTDGMSIPQKQLMTSYYYAKISLLDEYIGRIVEALKKRGLLDNTWILFTSDHGEMLGDYRLLGKSVFYEASATVPCVVRPPAGRGGWQGRGLVEHVDMTATLLEIAGAEPLSRCAGRSLVPIVQAGSDSQQAQSGKEAVFSEIKKFAMVRTDRYKASLDTQTMQPMELFDLNEDPQERRNLIDEPSSAGVLREMMERYLMPHLRGDSNGGES